MKWMYHKWVTYYDEYRVNRYVLCTMYTQIQIWICAPLWTRWRAPRSPEKSRYDPIPWEIFLRCKIQSMSLFLGWRPTRLGDSPSPPPWRSALFCCGVGGGTGLCEYWSIFDCFNGFFFASSTSLSHVDSRLSFSSLVQFFGEAVSMWLDLIVESIS